MHYFFVFCTKFDYSAIVESGVGKCFLMVSKNDAKSGENLARKKGFLKC